MKYLPILDELISSDLIYILLIGIGIAIIFALVNKNCKKKVVVTIVSFIIYIGCEVLCNMIYNYLATIILLFIGCLALGFAMCSLAIFIIVSIKKNK